MTSFRRDRSVLGLLYTGCIAGRIPRMCLLSTYSMMWGEPQGPSRPTPEAGEFPDKGDCAQSHPGAAGLSRCLDRGLGSQQAHLATGFGFYYILFYFGGLGLWLPLTFCIVARYLWESGLHRDRWTPCFSNQKLSTCRRPSSGPDAFRKGTSLRSCFPWAWCLGHCTGN